MKWLVPGLLFSIPSLLMVISIFISGEQWVKELCVCIFILINSICNIYCNSKSKEYLSFLISVENKQGPSSQESSKTHILDINSCTEEELAELPGVGLILAKKTIKIRNEKGNFTSVDEFIEN